MQPRMTRNRVLVPADEGDEKRSASYQMKRLQFDRKLEVLKTLKNKWHPGLRKRPFSIFLSDEENDTDEEFTLRRAEACKEYRKVVERLPTQPYRLISRIKGHPVPPSRELPASGGRKLAIQGCLFITGTALVVTCAGNSVAVTDCETLQVRKICIDPYDAGAEGRGDRDFQAIALSPTGDVVAVGAASGTVHLLSVKPDKIGWITDASWPAHHCPVTCLAFVPHTKDSDYSSLHLLTGSEDSTVCVWRINLQSRTKLLLARYIETSIVKNIAVSPDATMFWTAPNGCFWRLVLPAAVDKAATYNMLAGDKVLHIETFEELEEVCFLDSKTVVALGWCAPRRIGVFELRHSGPEKLTIKCVVCFGIEDTELRRSDCWQPVRRLSIHTKGEEKYAMCGGKDGSVMFFDLRARQKPSDIDKLLPDVQHMRLRHPQSMRPITAIAVHPTGTHLVAGTSKNAITIWKHKDT